MRNQYTKDNPYRVFSSGGGIQSVAVAVLQATGMLPAYDAHVFANVGDKAENPATLAYVRDHLEPYLESHDINYVQVQKRNRKGEVVDLFDQVTDPKRRSIIIPAFLGHGGHTNRQCTTDWKINQVDRYIKMIGAQYAEVGLGISRDEITRVKSREWHDRIVSQKGNTRKIGFWKRRDYPLIDLRLSRKDCIRVILKAGLPLPPKSSCFFCPFKRKSEWILMRSEQPELFESAAHIEDALNSKCLHEDKLYFLSRFKKPLRTIPEQDSMWSIEDDDCDGYCHT